MLVDKDILVHRDRNVIMGPRFYPVALNHRKATGHPVRLVRMRIEEVEETLY